MKKLRDIPRSHHSYTQLTPPFSASETSSYASSNNESLREPRPSRHQPEGPAAPPAIRSSTETPTPDDEGPTNCTVVLKVGLLSVLDDSALLHETYDDYNVFIEWKFLDFEQEFCETPESLPLPRNPHTATKFDTEKGAVRILKFDFFQNLASPEKLQVKPKP